VRAAIQNTATDLGATGWDQYYGYGLINANAALATISTNNPPVAAFSGTPVSGNIPLTVTFTDASTNSPTSWAWTFGDGGTSTLQNPSHIYTAAGTYTVALTATNAYGSNTLTKTSYITASANAPVAAFSGTPTSGSIPLTVTFTDASTYSPTSWAWTFGDGGTSTLQNPSHIYTVAGTYTVALTATNAYGSNTLTKTSYITATAAQCDDFADGSASNWLNSSGTWTASSYYLKGNSTTTNARLISPFGTFSTSTITASVRMNTGRTQRKARIIFGYTATNTYRYVEFDDVANRVNIGELISGTSYTRAYASYTFSSATWYAVTVTVASSGTVTAKVGTTTVTSYAFGTRTGSVGVGYNASNSDFDNYCVTSVVSAANDWEEMGDGVAEQTLPEGFALDQNYPNPFNPTTLIGYNLPSASHVTVEIFNVLGQRVKQLVNEPQGAGRHEVEWNSTDQSGNPVASGVYFYRLTTSEQTLSKKMLLLK
jgi:PKD repeat protein